jgi:hypothetical protein
MRFMGEDGEPVRYKFGTYDARWMSERLFYFVFWIPGLAYCVDTLTHRKETARRTSWTVSSAVK